MKSLSFGFHLHTTHVEIKGRDSQDVARRESVEMDSMERA